MRLAGNGKRLPMQKSSGKAIFIPPICQVKIFVCFMERPLFVVILKYIVFSVSILGTCEPNDHPYEICNGLSALDFSERDTFRKSMGNE